MVSKLKGPSHAVSTFVDVISAHIPLNGVAQYPQWTAGIVMVNLSGLGNVIFGFTIDNGVTSKGLFMGSQNAMNAISISVSGDYQGIDISSSAKITAMTIIIS